MRIDQPNVKGSSSFDGDIHITGSLHGMGGTVQIADSGAITGSLTVKGGMSLTGSLRMDGDDLYVNNIYLSGSIAITEVDGGTF